MLWLLAKKDGDESIVAEIKRGNEKLRREFIDGRRKFAAKCASKASGRFIGESDDEHSVALIALNEAINKFESEKGSFRSFAELTIRHRVIDHLRKQSFQKEVSLSETNGEELHPAEVAGALARHAQRGEDEARREEIAALSEALRSFGISFSKLSESAPKHADARKNAIELARAIGSSEDMLRKMRETKKLPVAELVAKTNAGRKTVERNRAYIMAMAIVCSGDFPHLQTYLTKRGCAK